MAKDSKRDSQTVQFSGKPAPDLGQGSEYCVDRSARSRKEDIVEIETPVLWQGVTFQPMIARIRKGGMLVNVHHLLKQVALILW